LVCGAEWLGELLFIDCGRDWKRCLSSGMADISPWSMGL
jgi:hypothetical protein